MGVFGKVACVKWAILFILHYFCYVNMFCGIILNMNILETLDTVSQIMIPIMGVSALFLVAKKNKWGFVIGFASQPFWFFTSWHNDQLGVLLLTIIYFFSWALGIYEWFYKDNKKEKLT